jgi:hypothetical protein
MRALVVALVVGVVTLAGCGGDDDDSAAANCMAMPTIAKRIESGLTVQGGGSLKNVRGVEGGDEEQPLYFVSGELEGPGMEGPGEVGTWASAGTQGGPLFAVDSIAQEFSEWPALDSTDEGVESSRNCVEALQE